MLKSEQIKIEIEAVNVTLSELNDRRWKQKVEATKTIEESFMPDFEKLESKLKELKTAYDTALVKEAYQRNDGAYPVGTRMAEWQYRYRQNNKTGKSVRVPELTGRIGVVEVYHRGCSIHGIPEQKKPYQPGIYIIRILKKDGGVSLKASYLPNDMWLPDGKVMKVGGK